MKVLRECAVRMNRPVYPEQSSRSGHHGIVVAEVRIGTDGKVLEVQVIESPDQQIKSAVETAIKDWVIIPISYRQTSAFVLSRVVFYFVQHNGVDIVIDPSEGLAPKVVHGPSPTPTR